MSYSFILYHGTAHRDQVAFLASGLTKATTPAAFNAGDTTLAFRDDRTGFLFEKEGIRLRMLPSVLHTSPLNEIAETVFKGLSQEPIVLPFETPSFIATGKDNALWIYNCIPGLLPVYYCLNGTDTWVFTESKAFTGSQIVPLQLREYAFFEQLGYQSGAPAESIFENIFRLRQGEMLHIEGIDREVFFPALQKQSYGALDEDEWAELLYDELINKTSALLKNGAGLALSGGYDSGSLAGIIHKLNRDLQAYSIGTAKINEFAEAKISADWSNAKHHTLTIQKEDYLQAYFHCLYLNELNDPVIAEGFPGIYYSCKLASGHTGNLLNGYGADILLGDLLESKTDINGASAKMLDRSATTGEFSSFIADHFNISSYPVYLSPEIINLCFSIPGELKVKFGVNKYVQRRMIEKHALMPPALLDIPKKGLHTGAGLPTMFEEINQVTGIEFKRKFMYHSLKMLFEKGTDPGNCDAVYLKKLATDE